MSARLSSKLQLLADASLIAVILGCGVYLWALTMSMPLLGLDFRQDYVAGKLLAEQGEIYGLNISRLCNSLFDHDCINMHPPLAAVFFAPLSQLNFQAAVTVWTIFSYFCLLLSCFFLGRLLLLSVRSTLVLTAFCSFWQPVTASITFGTLSIFLLFLCVTGFYLISRRMIMLGATFGAIAIHVKIFPLPGTAMILKIGVLNLDRVIQYCILLAILLLSIDNIRLLSWLAEHYRSSHSVSISSLMATLPCLGLLIFWATLIQLKSKFPIYTN